MKTENTAVLNKVVIIGMDGLSPYIVKRLMEQGDLPNFQALEKKGGFRKMKTTNPPQSPVAWAAFATGQNPGKNGIFDFIVRNPKNLQLSLSLSNFKGGKAQEVIKSPRFWQYTSRKGVPTVILHCPVTFPPDKVNGKMLSGMGVPDILGTEGTFSFYTSVKEEDKETTGGKVYFVRKSSQVLTYLYGPRIQKLSGKAENVKVPLKLLVQKDKVLAAFQDKKVELKVGEWSDWQEVTFPLGFMKKTHGIFKFYLEETEPEFKLYISPINVDPRKPFFEISYPNTYSREVAEKTGLYFTQGMPFDTWAMNEKRLDEEAFLKMADEIMEHDLALLDLELNQFDKGVFYFYFESSDIMQHMFWRYTDPQHPLYEPDAPEKYKNQIDNWYKRMDAVLGKITQQVNQDDVLIVLSDHGFNTFRRAVHINSWLRDNGYLHLTGDADQEGKPLLGNVDWSKTKAYAIGFGSIYINEKGREKDGIVDPGDKDALIKEISAKLSDWVDDKYQDKIVSQMYERDAIFQGAFQDQSPDIVVGFNVGYRASWQTALGAAPLELIEDNLKKWSGSHLFDPRLVDGVLFSNKPLVKEKPSIMDIAPSILKMAGYTDEEIKSFDLDGDGLF